MAQPAADALQKSHGDWSTWRSQNQAARHDLSGIAFVLDGAQGPWDLSNCNLSKCRISGTGALLIDVGGFDLSDASFASESLLQSIRLDKGTVLDRVHFDGATLSGADFSPVVLNGTSFFRSIVRSVKFGSRIPASLAGRCQRLLDDIESATKPDDPDIPGNGYKRTGAIHSLDVNGVRRINYEWRSGQAADIDYV